MASADVVRKSPWVVVVNPCIVVLLALLAGTLLALNLYAPAEPTPWQRFLASLLIALCSLPTLLWASARVSHHSLMPYYGGLYALMFGTPVFLREAFVGFWFRRPEIDEAFINQALLLALVGWLCLLAGYFGPHRKWLADKLPRVDMADGDDRRYALGLALIVGIFCAPFFYADCVDKTAHYTGQTIIPPALAFPVHLLGQFTLFSVSILFFLQLRGNLRLAGRIFLWGLVAFYTLGGLSTGLVLPGTGAAVALFMAYAVARPFMPLRLFLCGVLLAGFIVLVLIPLRFEFRTATWTRGAGPSVRIWDETFHFRGASGHSGKPIIESSRYNVYLEDNRVLYVSNSSTGCGGEPVDENTELLFFLHVYPVNTEMLEARRREDGFHAHDFRSTGRRTEINGRCVYEKRLPDYDISHIRTGQYYHSTSRSLSSVNAYINEHIDSASNPSALPADTSQVKRAVLFAQQLMDIATSGEMPLSADRGPLTTMATRIDNLIPFAWVISRTPGDVPYWGGETYSPLLFKLIPRAMFPNKPENNNDFRHRYDFWPKGNDVNGFRLHQSIEMYANFGPLAVPVGMFILGLLYRVVYQLFFHNNATLVSMAAGVPLLTVLLTHSDSTAANTWGFVLWYLIFLLLLNVALVFYLRTRITYGSHVLWRGRLHRRFT